MGHPDLGQYSGMIKAVAWLLSALSTCFVLTRFATKLSMTKKWTIDDTMILFALAFSYAQSIVLTVATSYGWGQQAGININDPQLIQQEKFIYISSIFFFLSMCFGMLSISQLILNLSPQRSHQIMSWTISGATVVWTLVAIFGFAFQCSLPVAWDFVNGQCYHQQAFYTFIACANLVIELALIVQPAIIIWNLRMALRQKLIIIACFCGRTFVAAALIGLVVALWQLQTTAESMLYYGVVLTMVLADNFSIMAASIPYLKPFLQGLENSMSRIEMLPQQTGFRGSYAAGTNFSRLHRGTKAEPMSPTSVNGRGSILDERERQPSGYTQSNRAPSSIEVSFLDQKPILGGDSRSTKSQDFARGIMQTSEYTVESWPIETHNVIR